MLFLPSMTKDFELESYNYDLPTELIAQRPCEQRPECRLLIYKEHTGEIIHDSFKNLKKYLPQNSHLFLNNSKVIPCRLQGKKPTGGRAEIFILDISPNLKGEFQGLIKTSGKKKVGDQFLLPGNIKVEISRIEEGVFYLNFPWSSSEDCLHYLEQFGQMPIPPYIRDGQADGKDLEDYQTVYAKDQGSVAAPTAGLHFSKDLLSSIDHSFLTLHVGMGTFKPVSTLDIREHRMHSETFFIDEEVQAKMSGGHYNIAVGTTSLRAMESCFRRGFPLGPQQTDIFLYPGVEVQSSCGLITNFHLPKSSLLMLVSSLIGREKMLEIYQEAVEQKYRFYSYGDAMLLLKGENV